MTIKGIPCWKHNNMQLIMTTRLPYILGITRHTIVPSSTRYTGSRLDSFPAATILGLFFFYFHVNWFVILAKKKRNTYKNNQKHVVEATSTPSVSGLNVWFAGEASKVGWLQGREKNVERTYIILYLYL